MNPAPPRPDVTVIVIVYNDAGRLENAVRSVVEQSLRSVEAIIVDDSSTDATPEVAARLAAAYPERVRSVRLPENSGGCGRPRNVGMSHASGRFVMFLDSDDTLDRHACRNLVTAAERTGADLVIGRCVRHYVERDKDQAWMPWLVQKQAVYESLQEEPELLYDVLSTNKLYRRDFLTRENLVFLEDRYYEDNLFSVHAYLTAKRIAVIPERIYVWNVEEEAATASITRRLGSSKNLVDRLAVTRQIDELLARYGTPELELQKDVRFIENDLRTHLAPLPRLPEETQRELVELARPYLAGLNAAAFESAKRLPAVAAYLARQGDYAGVADVHRYMTSHGRRQHLTTDLVERDGRVYWCDRHLDDPLGRSVLDVTDLYLHDLPLGKLQLGSRITGVERDGDRVTLRGEITNPLGRITEQAEPRASLEFKDRRGGRRRFRIKAKLEVTPTRVYWRATFDPSKVLRPLGVIDGVYDSRLLLTVGAEKTDLHLFAESAVVDALRLAARPRLSTLTGDVLEAYVTMRDTLALRLAGEGRTASAGTAAIRRLRSTHLGRGTWNSVRNAEESLRGRLTRRPTKLNIYHRFLTRLPVRQRLVVFESHMGRQYSDSPRYIYEELRRAGLKYQPVWVYANDPSGFPSDVKLVRRESWAYYRALARARFWVDNQGFPHDLRKRPETTYIQTWHGSAFKRMGFDQADVKRLTREAQTRLEKAVDRFDVFLVRSQHDVDTLVSGMRVSGELMPVGYPRNDALVNGGDPAELAELRSRLELDDRRVVLYAPTFRPGPGGRGAQALEVPFDLEHFVRRFGDEMILLVRPHYLARFGLSPALRHAVRNVAGVHDITPLLLLSDALITDYSSVMFDYSLLDRPMIFHVPDYEDYVGNSRGSYFDLAQHAPGPITHHEQELFGALADLDASGNRYAEQRKLFVARFGEHDQGRASKAVVERFFIPGGRRG